MKTTISLGILRSLFLTSFVSLLCLLPTKTLFAAPQIAELPVIETFYDLSAHVQQIKVNKENTGLVALFTNNKELFTFLNSMKVPAKNQVRAGLVSGKFWYYTQIHNNSNVSQDLLLEFDFPLVQALSLYALTQNSNTTKPELIFEGLGTTTSFADRSISYRNIAQPVTLTAGESKTLIWQVEHTGIMNFRILAWNPQHFYGYVQMELLAFGILYGLLVMIGLYSLFIYFSNRDPVHFHFACFVFLISLLIACREGQLFQFFLPEMQWPRSNANEYILAALHIAFSLFCTNYLNLKRWSPTLFTAIVVLASISSLLFIAGNYVEDPIQIYAPALFLSVALYLTALWSAIYLRKKGVTTASHFAAGILAFIAIIFFSLLNTVDLLPTFNGYFCNITIASTLMVLMFSAALNNKLRVLQREQLSASMELVKLTEDKLKSKIEFYKEKLQQTLLDKAQDEVKIENRAKNEFLATMSHEIRTPMNSVLGMTDLLLDTDLSKQQQGFVHYIYNSGQSLLAAINDLLDYSKIEAGQMSLDCSVFYLDDLIDDCIAVFAPKAADKQLHFVGNIQTDIEHELKGDATKLRQMILHLLNQTFEFEQADNVTLEVFQTNANSINSVEVRFEITISGTVLTNDECEALFVPFCHNESLATNTHEGSGLALTICQQLAELMHGDMGITSSVDTGTMFWFTARFILPHAGESAEHKDRSTVLDGKRLLVVDEDVSFCNLITTLSSAWKMRVDAVTIPSQALQVASQAIIDKQPFDLLILPKLLGGLSDCENMIKEVKRESQHSLLAAKPAFILTTDTGTDEQPIGIEEYHRLAVDGLLEKPVNSKRLYDILLKTLGGVSQDSFVNCDPVSYDYLRVLIVEDNEVNLLVIEGMLKKFNVEPVSAINGELALAAFNTAQKPFDLIFMDCEMPGMDGYQVTQEIRKIEADDCKRRPDDRHTLILALSAHSVDDGKDKALNSGMDAYLTKPIKKKDVENILKKYFPQHTPATHRTATAHKAPATHKSDSSSQTPPHFH